jgi:uncharacterized protein (TIGR02598 family)
MHTPPPSHQTFVLACPESPSPQRRRIAGFSLIEVTLAIAIVAFAFVALLGLLPAGMSVFNQTQDATNITRMAQDLSSMLQSTEFSKLDDSRITGNIYYFDIDGALLDSKLAPVSTYEDQRIYAARIVMDEQNRPSPGAQFYNANDVARRAIIVLGRNIPDNIRELESITNADSVRSLGKAKLTAVPMVIAKSDGVTANN